MHWSREEHESLLRFFENVTSSDPTVQAENISQLHRLAQWEAAPYATLEVMCHSHYAPSIRQAAVLILKQLLQTEPEFIERLDVKRVEPVLLNALADPISNVRVGTCLVIASIVNGKDLFCRWPTLLQTLHLKSCHMFIHCQEENNTEDLSFILQSLVGIATCVRILCEECSMALCEFLIKNEEVCRCWSELLQQLMQTVSILLQRTSSALPAVVAVMEAVTSCFTEKIFALDEDNNDDLESFLTETNDVAELEPHDVFNYALSLHEASCLFIVQLGSWLTNTSLLPVVINYMNTSLQWSAFGCNGTQRAASAVLPQILQHITTVDEEIVVLCLEFISYLAEYETAGMTAGLSNFAEEVAKVIFHCGVMSSPTLEDFSLERTIHLPDNETTVRPILSCQQTRLVAVDEDKNNNRDEDDDDSHSEDVDICEETTSVRPALTQALNVMCRTCRNDLFVHLVPLLASVFEMEPHTSFESQKILEAALFLFSEIVEELFDGLNCTLVSRVAQKCWVVLTTSVDGSYILPYVVRYQAVRCVARISSGYLTNVKQIDSVTEKIFHSSALQLLADVVDNDPNKVVQIEAIRSITHVALAVLEKYRRNGDTDTLCLPPVFHRLLNTFPLLQLGARTATYQSISQVFPMALNQPPVLDDTTVLRTISVLVTHGYQLGYSFLSTSPEVAPFSAAVELVSLLNAMVELTCNAGGSVITQVLPPLVDMSTMLVNCCNNDNPSSPLTVYSNDIITMVFDMLDGCCDNILNGEEALCSTEESKRGGDMLRNLMMTEKTANCQTHVVGLCLQLMELHPLEVELRRSCFAFLCNVVRFCGDPVILWKIYLLCIYEANCTPPAEKVISNTFLCLAEIFYRLVFKESSETTSLFYTSFSQQDLSALVNALGYFLFAAQSKGGTHVKTNAFSCVLTLAALHPLALSHFNTKDTSFNWLLKHAVSFLPEMKGDVGDEFRALTTLALLFSREQEERQKEWHQSQQKEDNEDMLPFSLVATVRQALVEFTTSAPEALAAEVWRCWMPWINRTSS